jgi:hypothetical protein
MRQEGGERIMQGGCKNNATIYSKLREHSKVKEKEIKRLKLKYRNNNR